MNSYSLQLKSLDNQATAFLNLEVSGHHHAAVEAARKVAARWGRCNGSSAVEYTVSFGEEWSKSETVAAHAQPSPFWSVNVQIDSKDKFFAVLDALQQYVDNCDDAIGLAGDLDKIRDLAAKSNAAGEVVAQLEEVLVSLAG